MSLRSTPASDRSRSPKWAVTMRRNDRSPSTEMTGHDRRNTHEAALRHLEDCYQRIDRHHSELVGWVRTMDEARAHMAAFAQTDAFHDMMVNGIAADGSFAWPHTGIVRVLREATKALSQGGWTRLDRAREWMAENHPDQTPSKYSCRTWPQVLSESKLFELVYRVGDDGRRVGWFRERAGS